MAIMKLPAIPEKHTARVWWTIRVIEIITCFFIIAGVIHHW